MKKMILPRTSDGSAAPTVGDNVRRVVIIGANGAGKTRFTRRMCELSGEGTMELSALSGLYTVDVAARDGDFYDRMFMDSVIGEGEKMRPQTKLERMLALLMNDELMQLLARKFAGKPASGTPTRLDAVVGLFHEIFPNNTVLVESGRFLFRRPGSDDRYESTRLSDGERTVLYYAASILYAPEGANIVVDSPEIFLHPTTIQAIWNRLEILRPDCRFVYTTHDLEFAASRQGAVVLWVRGWDSAGDSYDYSLLEAGSQLGEDIYLAIMGDRRDVLFIEGDSRRSIDAKLYPLLFRDYTVKSVGSCDRVIEATRTFNSLSDFHHMRARGIVDRDRRALGEVDYLRRRCVMVPEVAEIENMFMLEDVIRTVAADCGRDPEKVFSRVRRGVLGSFRSELREQALEHTRHGMKKTVEYRVDGRFANIRQLEQHIARLCIELNPRGVYDDFCRQFQSLVDKGDYAGVLRVYNHKSMIAASNVAQMCGLATKDAYISRVLRILSQDSAASACIRSAALRTLCVADTPGDTDSKTVKAER